MNGQNNENHTYRWIRTILPVAVYILVSALASTVIRPGIAQTAAAGLIMIPAGLYMMKRDGLTFRNERSGIKISFAEAAAAAVLCVSAGIGLNILISISGIMEADAAFRAAQQSLFGAYFPVTVLVTGFIVPAAEEIVFRGLCFGRLRSFLGFVPACLASAFFFGVYHGNLVQGIYAFFMGLVLAYIRERFRSVSAAAAAHMLINLCVLGAGRTALFGYLSGRISVAAAVAAGCFIAAGVSMIYLRKKSEIS